MRRTILFALALLVASATLATADGLIVRWEACSGDGGVQNRTFACDSNAGTNRLIGSFSLNTDLPQVNGDELVLDLASASPTLPDWWRFKNAGSCRQLALTIAAQDGFACPDLFALQASMNIASYVVGTFGPNTARILSVNAVPSIAAMDLTGGQEYTFARWSISNIKTVGTGACGGCATPVCILFNIAHLTTEGGLNDTILSSAAFPGSNIANWQSPINSVCVRTPSRNSTWGAVKSLYR